MRIERDGELAIVRMEAGKANAMGPTMLGQLGDLVAQVRESNARAVVLTGDGRSFSAGLALPELVDLDREAARAFIDRFSSVMLAVYRLPMPVVAAIDGHAIAGGCVLACQCDVRLVADIPCKIGLNEVQLGIGFPAVVTEPLRLFLPPASFVAVGLQGGLFAPDDALRLGLVDEVVEPTRLFQRACERARELASVPAVAFAQVKLAWRRPAIEAIESTNADVRERWLDTWFSAEAQSRLRATVDKLRKR